MKLKTSLQLSAVFPIMFALVVTMILNREFSKSGSDVGSNNVLVLTGVLGLAMAGVIMFYSRDILKKIEVLHQWLNAVSSGDLSHRDTISDGDDEISRLSLALSKTLYKLKSSEDDLQGEAAKYKTRAVEQEQRAEASHKGSQHLSTALSRLRDSQEQIVHRERLHVLNQVIRGVTHDLNETLTPILGATDLLLGYQETLDDRDVTVDNLRTIKKAAHRIRKTAKSLSAFCNTKSGDLTRAPVDISRAVRDAIEYTAPRWREEARSRGSAIVMKTSVEEDLRPVAAEQDELRDAVVHLISNAIEAMPDGGTITIVARAAADDVVTLEVSDSGRGMSDAEKVRCLEPFYTSKGGIGTGMGLAIVVGTVQSAEGELEIESKAGDGTTVRMKIPAWTVAAEVEHSAQLEFAEKLTVLIVDDEFWSREAVSKGFARDGHTCETAACGTEGLAKFREQEFDAVIVDLAMPDMGGDHLARLIKQENPTVPIILLTGFGDLMLAEGDVPEHIDSVVPKPATSKDLYRAIGKVISAGSAA